MYRMMLEEGLNVAAGTDWYVGHLNPWHNMYYMVTGRNVRGVEVNAGQTVTRVQALRMYTMGSAWANKSEKILGSIETGKLADLVVLSADPVGGSDQDLLTMRSMLTLVNGKVVYADAAFMRCDKADRKGRWFGTRTSDACRKRG
jgi:hypothetical protein